MTTEHSLIGRAEDLATTWDTLERRSLLLTGPRRVGKTELLRALVTDPRPGWVAVRIDLEGETTVAGAVARIREGLSRAGRLTLVEEARALAPTLEGIDLAGTGLRLAQPARPDPWDELRALLRNAIDGLPRETERLVLALDEVPWWLDGLVQEGGEEAARLALARLRSLRQSEDLRDKLRLVLTGSVGLAGLAHDIGASAELNDITPVQELRRLDAAATRTLFEMELTERGLEASEAAMANACRVTGGIPHWVKNIAERIRPPARGEPVGTDDVARVVDELLQPRMRNLFADEGGEHLARREPKDKVPAMVAILGAASQVERTPEEALVTAALAAAAGHDRKWAIDALYRLADAYYLERSSAGEWEFVVPLLRLWWQRYGGG